MGCCGKPHKKTQNQKAQISEPLTIASNPPSLKQVDETTYKIMAKRPNSIGYNVTTFKFDPRFLTEQAIVDMLILRANGDKKLLNLLTKLRSAYDT